jgi:Peptidase family M23
MRPPLLDPILAWPAAGAVALLAFAALLVAPASVIAHTRWRWPARGAVVGRFHFDPARRFARGQRRGVVVAARPGARVRAACAGPVTFAGRVGRSGLVVSQSCGRRSATYLRLGAIAARRGASLAPGDDVGTIAASGRYGLGARVRSRADGYVDPLGLLGRGPTAAPRPPARPPRVAPAPVPRRSPLPPSSEPSPTPPRAPLPASSKPMQPASIGLPLGIWWLPTGLAMVGATALLCLAGWLARSSRAARDAPSSNHAGPARERPIA